MELIKHTIILLVDLLLTIFVTIWMALRFPVYDLGAFLF